MGTYLATGIVQKIGISKKDITAEVTGEAIATALRKEVDLDCYAYSEDEDGVYWKLKPHMLEGNFPEFLERQLKMYDEQDKNWRETLKQVTQAQTGQERLDLAEDREKHLYHFQLIEHIYDSLRVKQENSFETRVVMIYNLIALFMDGKIIMECYGNILRYFTQNIRLQNQQYPISHCFKIMITS